MTWEQTVDSRLQSARTDRANDLELFDLNRKDFPFVSADPSASDNVSASELVIDLSNAAGFWIDTGVSIKIPATRDMTLAFTLSVVVKVNNAVVFFALTDQMFPEQFDSVPLPPLVIDREYPGARSATPQYCSRSTTFIRQIPKNTYLYLQAFVRYSTYDTINPQICIINNLNLSAKEL